MIKFVILLIGVYFVHISDSVAIYGQCDGGAAGKLPCDSGLTCCTQSQYYSQCLNTCPAGWTAESSGSSSNSGSSSASGSSGSSSGSGSGSSSGSSGSNSGSGSGSSSGSSGSNSGSGSGSSSSSGTCPSSFPKKQFKLGISFDNTNNCGIDLSNYDYISIWMDTIDGSGSTNFNPYYQGTMLSCCIKNNKIPLFYAYVIAFEARKAQGIQDCNVSPTNNLCTNGAQFIRNNRQFLVNQYSYQATQIANYIKTNGGNVNNPVIFTMEPDFWQYYGDDGTNGKVNQTGGALSGNYMRALFDDFVGAIKAQLPNAIISWDISSWIGQSGFQTWWGFFSNDTNINFINTSGGQSQGQSENIQPNQLTWSFVHTTTGKYIIADCGYGVGGAASNTCTVWQDQTNEANRINDGVIALSIAQTGVSITSKPAVNC